MDPPRAEAKAAIALRHQAGIQVKMITGDHQVTAAAIARELALVGHVVSGADYVYATAALAVALAIAYWLTKLPHPDHRSAGRQ